MKLAVLGTWALAAVLAVGHADAAAAQQRPAAKPAQPKPAAGDAGGAAGTKIGFVNIQAILKQTPGYAKAESTFAKELDGYRTEVQKLQATLDSAAQDFEAQSAVLNPSQRASKRKDLEAQQEKLQQRTQELQQKAASRERELLDPIQARVNSVIEGIRAAGNYAIIFDVSAPGNGIVTGDKSLDLTQRVLDQLQASK
ncbi:MAG TPA: OmpH family outer membrane protein [Gemmatimonadales bacterium]|jgi:outer membrane protein|nr:OmpH family outer membrane protein [Gemmatimonadales bacterium]